MRLFLLLLLISAAQDTDESLHQAVRAGEAAEVRTALDAGADIDGADASGRTALMLAVGLNDKAMVELLLGAGADATKRDPGGLSALTIAKADGSPELVSLLRDAGAQESAEEHLDEAIRNGDLDAVIKLIEEGVDVNALDTEAYQTPLMTALELRKLDILLRLVEAGADPTREGTGFETTGENAISVAARQGSPWALRLLLESSPRRANSNQALMLGCAHAGVVRVALEAGANVNATDDNGETALICAASAGATDSVAALLEAGANADATTPNGRTALDSAKRKGYDDVVSLLARH